MTTTMGTMPNTQTTPKLTRRVLRSYAQRTGSPNYNLEESVDELYPVKDLQNVSREYLDSDSAENSPRHSNPKSPTRNVHAESYAEAEHTSKYEQSPSSHESKTESAKPTPKSAFPWLYIFLIVAIALAALCALVHSTASKDKGPQTRYDELLRRIEKLRRKYPTQDNSTWDTIGSAVNGILQANPEEPCVILLVSHQSETLHCFATHLGQEMAGLFGDQKLLQLQITNSMTKKDVDTPVKKKLETDHVVVLERIEKLSADIPLLLHGYADNENSQFKNHIFILTLVYMEDSLEKSANAVAERALTNAWKNLDYDKTTSVLSRIVGSAVVIKRERNVSC